MPYIIDLNNISKIYNNKKPNELTALSEVSLKINEGEMCAICGTSGAGKSTLLNIIGLVDYPTFGEYLLDGTDVSKYNDSLRAKTRNQYFGYVLQDYGLISGRSVYDNVSVPLVFSKTKQKDFKNTIKNCLDFVGINDLSKRKIDELSGGQKQRVAIARALVNSPKIILADEPTGALDSKTGSDIISCFKEVNKNGITVFIVTHDENIAKKCDKIIHINDGRISDI